MMEYWSKVQIFVKFSYHRTMGVVTKTFQFLVRKLNKVAYLTTKL